MRSSFPFFQSHIDLAHLYWSKALHIGDTVIDATCGNGHDTLKLCKLTLSNDKGQVYSFDIQEQAIDKANQLLGLHLQLDLKERVILEQRCHSTFPQDIAPCSVQLIVYNLGYLPGGDKAKTTEKSTTLKSLENAASLLRPGGMISITCYCGHEEGAKEQEEVLRYASQLCPKKWSCCHHSWLNRRHAPSLLLIQKALV